MNNRTSHDGADVPTAADAGTRPRGPVPAYGGASRGTPAREPLR